MSDRTPYKSIVYNFAITKQQGTFRKWRNLITHREKTRRITLWFSNDLSLTFCYGMFTFRYRKCKHSVTECKWQIIRKSQSDLMRFFPVTVQADRGKPYSRDELGGRSCRCELLWRTHYLCNARCTPILACNESHSFTALKISRLETGKASSTKKKHVCPYLALLYLSFRG